MASPTSQLTLRKATEIVNQNQHGDIDPAVTTFVVQGLDDIWRRIKEQPSTYVLTNEEFAVFSYYRDAFSDNEIAQQAVHRFWLHQAFSKSADAKKPAVSSPPTTGDINLSQEQNHRMQAEKKAKQAKARAKLAARGTNTSKRLASPCQRCRDRQTRCDAKKPICSPCDRAGLMICTKAGQKKDEKFAGPNCNVDESTDSKEDSPFPKNSEAAADRRKQVEAQMKFSQESDLNVSMKGQRERNQHMISSDTPVEKLDEPTLQDGELDQGLSKSPRNLSVGFSRFCVETSNGKEYNFVNSMKLYVEYLTGEGWDWWPLGPSFQELCQDGIRIQWHCDSGHTHWTVFSKTDFISSQEALKRRIAVIQVPPLKRKQPESSSENSSSTGTSRSSGSESSTGRSSPATSESGSSNPPNDKADSGKDIDPPGASIAVDIVPPSNLSGFVLFGVHGSKRLQSACLRLAQIDVSIYKDDDSFFDEMTVQYKKLRGFIRWVLSIWVFSTCEFVMFHKANPNEIMPGPNEIPSSRDRDYNYNASRNPPILSTVFNISFYGCKKACIKSQFDLLCLFHECKGHNHCGKYRVLERLPKRRRKWDIDRDEEKEEAWGLNAVFAVSFYKVALYHTLILAGPVVFWGLWLNKWPTDWQNASVQFFAVVVLLSLFWLPFAHNASSADRKRRSKMKSI